MLIGSLLIRKLRYNYNTQIFLELQLFSSLFIYHVLFVALLLYRVINKVIANVKKIYLFNKNIDKNHYKPDYFHQFWGCLGLIIATVVVFYYAWTYDFINYDDSVYVYENPNIQAGFTSKAIRWVFAAGYASNWHPVAWLSYMLDWQLYGSKAGPERSYQKEGCMISN